ncbi:MAG TPA: ferrochelatase [Gammaproteobacteria bacterium]|nr:ferrochelatase [Gammaproteobacteria bacterium]
MSLISGYDALLIVSFGGPEGPADVSPFLDNVFRGLRVSPETKAHVAKRYETFGGVSPINAQTRAFIKALQHELDAHGPALPIYWGNRNWHPLLTGTITQMANAGVRRALAYVTSTFSSYSGCRKYREDLYEAVQAVPSAPRIDKLRVGYNHPGFIEAMTDRVAAALDSLPKQERAGAAILFTAHSLPESMARNSRYEVQLAASCRLVGDALEHQRWRLVYQSNNASYGREPWLGPDIGTALRETRAEGVTSIVIAPIGFVCDHMEVVLDLDVEAAVIARGIGLNMVRAATVGTHPAYVAMVRELVVERLTPDAPRRALGSLGPSHDRCAPDCCLSGRPGPAKQSLGGVDDPFSIDQ